MGKIVYWGFLTVSAMFCGGLAAMQHDLFWTLFGAMLVAFDMHMLFKAIEEHQKKEIN